MADIPPTNLPPEARRQMEPHRDSTILVFGILGFIICLVFGILAWVMGKNDLDKMDRGLMDPAGRSTTKTGKLLGMISTIIAAAGLGLATLIFIITGGLALTFLSRM